MNVVLRIDGPSIDAQEIADRIVRDVMTIIIAEGEESMIVDMHLIAGLHVGKAKEVRIAPAIEEEDISGLGHRVEPPTGRLSAFDLNTRDPTIRSEERRVGEEGVATC